jgi:hypothetical protein
VFSSPEQTQDALASVGYITDLITATVVYLSARLLVAASGQDEADRRKLLLRDGWASLVYDAQQYSLEAIEQ